MKKDVILKSEKLAKLVLGKERFSKISKNFTDIIAYIDLLKHSNVKDLPESFNASGLSNVAAEDEPIEKDHLTQEQVLSNAKRSYKGFIQVDKVI